MESEFNFANMQSALLAIGCMFFVVGSTLEYAKHAEYIVAGITLFLGLLKTYVKLNY